MHNETLGNNMEHKYSDIQYDHLNNCNLLQMKEEYGQSDILKNLRISGKLKVWKIMKRKFYSKTVKWKQDKLRYDFYKKIYPEMLLDALYSEELRTCYRQGSEYLIDSSCSTTPCGQNAKINFVQFAKSKML